MAVAARLTAIVQADTGQATANLKGFGAEVTRTRQQVQTETRNIATSFQNALGGVSLQSIGGLVGVAGIGGLAMTVGNTVVQLGILGQDLRKQRGYFDVWSGGVANAEENLRAMHAAVGDYMTDSEMMGAANQLLSMGIAGNAEELAFYAKGAVMLGGATRSAGEAINDFALMMANQSVERLDTFGISSAKARKRIEELMSANADLSREEAWNITVKEELIGKMAQVEAGAFELTTQTQNLGKAWRETREEIALGLNTSGVTGNLAGFVENVGDALGGWMGNDAAKLEGLSIGLAKLEEGRAQIAASPSPFQEWRLGLIDTEIAKVIQQMQLAQIAAGDWARGVTMAEPRIRDGAIAAQQALTGLKLTMGSGPGWGNLWGSGAPMSTQAAYGVAQAADMEEKRKELEAELIKGVSGGGISTAFADSLEDGAREASGRIAGYISGAISASKGLFDATGGAGNMQPGANGPFENVFRALDVAKLGSASPWAAQLGMDQETAKRLTGQFQQGLLTPEVTSRLIDVDALIQQAGLAAEAEKLTNAFAAEVAKAAGTDGGVVKALMGMPTAGAQGGEAKSINIAQPLAAAISADLTTNAATIQTQGGNAWLLLEAGMLAQAKKSNVLTAAVEAILDGLLEDYTAGK